MEPETYEYIIRIRNIQQYRVEWCPVIHMNESYFHCSMSVTKQWTNNDKSCLQTLINKEQWVFVLHTGGEYGFWYNELKTFKSGSKQGDNSHNMKYKSYEKGLTEMLIMNLNKTV